MANIDNRTRSEFERLARRNIWWKTPDEALQTPKLAPARGMYIRVRICPS
jgi:hypothetical protein